MPWNTKSQHQKKKELIRLVMRKEVSMSEASRLYEISRRAGNKWLRRYGKQGEKGLEEISRKPHNQATKLNEDIICRIVEVRIAHRSWGADKIQAVLRREGKTPVPCRSSIQRILVKSSLVKRVRKRRKDQQNIRLSQEGEGVQKVNDERMHRDMKKELQAQKVDTQSEIDEWVRIFNFERPHQALQGDTPAEHYHKSSRKYKGSLVEIDYGKMPTGSSTVMEI